ncbi:MAG: serine/threonine-protein kinase [Coriobacteriales bacterium]|nr:serine/threonine-protein kinase [Coriobacteriales bacterium]
MRCAHCGYQSSPGASFCARCGRALGTAEADQAVAGPAAQPPSGNALDHIGPYRLLEEIGRGAMARVWRAWDTQASREVAIKEPLFGACLPPQVAQEMERRFVREGYMASRLTHPNIVAVYEAGAYDGRLVIVMELVDGITLGTLLERGPLAPTAAMDVLDQLIDAVSYAHYMGIVHRDIKPDNVFVTRDGSAKLADFGIAHLASAGTDDLSSGMALGTPGYMSPEQVLGQEVDERSDVFSIGVVAYEMLSGHNPFGVSQGLDSTAIMSRTVHDEVPELRACGVPAATCHAIMMALQKDACDRPQSVKAFKTLLHGMTRVPATSARSDSIQATVSGGQPGGQMRIVCAIAVVVVLFLLVLMLSSAIA